MLLFVGAMLLAISAPNLAPREVYEGTFDPSEYGLAVENIHLEEGDYLVWVKQVDGHDDFTFSTSPWLNGSVGDGSEGYYVEDEGTTTDFDGVRYYLEMGFWVDGPNRYDIEINAQREIPETDSLSVIVQRVATIPDRLFFVMGVLLVIFAGVIFLSMRIFRTHLKKESLPS